MRIALALVLLAAGCGYAPLNRGGASTEQFAVVLTSSSVPDAVASDEVVAGVRDELARSGALASGESYPRCEVEVLRADETSDGIAANHGAPEARATRVGIVARAWIVRAKDAPRERDTGDVRALDEVATAPSSRAASFQFSDALRASGRRVGHDLGARVLGRPSASDE